MDMRNYLNKWPSLGQLGLKARRCLAEENCRVKPIQLSGGQDSTITLALFVEDGNILGIDVADNEEFETLFNYGETWDNVDEDDVDVDPRGNDAFGWDAEPTFDFLSGEQMGSCGWTVTRRLDGDTKSFDSLTGILSALNGGAFGVSLWSPQQLDDPEPTCPESTCNGCPDPDTCDGLRSAEFDDLEEAERQLAEYPTFDDIRDERDAADDFGFGPIFVDDFPGGINMREPRGWNAPEFSRAG